MADITLSKLAQCTGLKPRTLQFWTLNGVIHCDPETEHGGPGVPRRYSEDEVAIALVLREIIRMPLQVGALREIAERFREIMRYGPENGVEDPVHWVTSGGGDDLWAEMVRVEKSRAIGSGHEAMLMKRKFYELRDWCSLQLALRNVKSVATAGRKRIPVDEQILELSVDDIGRWQLSIQFAGHFKEQEVDVEAPPVWSLRLLLNLTRAFTRLPSRSEEPEADADDGEVA